MRVSHSQLSLNAKNPGVVTPNPFRQGNAPADGLVVSDAGKRTAQPLKPSQSYTKGGSLNHQIAQPCYRSCIHIVVSLTYTSSVVFLDKSLTISLKELEGRRAVRPILYTSTLSICLGVSSRRKSSTGNKPAKTGIAMLDGDKCSQSACSGQSRGPLSKQRDRKVDLVGPIHGVNSKAGDSETQHHSATLGLLSFRVPRPSNTKAAKQKGNADEAAFTTLSNFRHGRHSFKVGPVDSRTWHRQTKSDKIEWQEAVRQSTKPQTSSRLCEETRFYHSRRMADSLEGTTRTLSLKEALELFRPDFISRSQERLRRLEQCVKRRKALQDSNPDLVQALREDRGKPKKNCTTPDPISDNLFKPRERSISGREMQLRSRRIYNKLPEVTKKKEEEKKRAISQTNRLRAEVFKKRVLDQILQRF